MRIVCREGEDSIGLYMCVCKRPGCAIWGKFGFPFRKLIPVTFAADVICVCCCYTYPRESERGFIDDRLHSLCLELLKSRFTEGYTFIKIVGKWD